MNTPTTDFLTGLEAKLEEGILGCLRWLEEGLAEALRELCEERENVGTAMETAEESLRRLAGASRQQVETIHQSLGRLSMALHQFVLTDPLEIENLSAFDNWKEELLRPFEEAREPLRLIQADGEASWKAYLESAWRRFGDRLEEVRTHLEEDGKWARERLEAERVRLAVRVGKVREMKGRDPQKARAKILEMAGAPESDAEDSDLGGWAKALLMWRDKPVPEEVRKMLAGVNRSRGE